ncbi:MAG: sugar ABC transporter ATP-binding protein [Actinomycetia bacterium]|nr:sugar ABC transporter ATP-binding protein [Actinomycetes bacterium]
MTEKSYIVEFDKISKSFPGVKALIDVSFGVIKGEVHALVGENGAGKSTLIKICGGVYQKDAGKILWEGKEISIRNPKHAQEFGISIVYQEPALCQNLSVAGSIFLGRELITKYGSLDWNTMYERTKKPLEILGANINPKTYVNSLTIVQRQIVEIAKALSINAKLIIMDEPTSALTMDDTKKLFKVIHNLKSEGITVIYVSHRLEEVFEIADRITTLRDGKHVATEKKKDSNPDQVASLMVGRKLIDMFPKMTKAMEETVLKVVNLSCKGSFEDISFEAKKGEILGIAGLRGSGNSNLLRALFGIEKIDNGKIYLNEKLEIIKNPKEAMKLKIGYIAADRHAESLFLKLNVRDNVSFLVLNELKRLGLVSSTKKDTLARRFVEELKIRTPSLVQLVENLSGGNQQKVAVAKWLATKAKILLMDDPTRGIDVGAKAEIHNLISILAKQGDSIIMTSSELQELIGLCHRILIMYKGKIKAEFTHDDVSEEKIIKYAAGAVA